MINSGLKSRGRIRNLVAALHMQDLEVSLSKELHSSKCGGDGLVYILDRIPLASETRIR